MKLHMPNFTAAISSFVGVRYWLTRNRTQPEEDYAAGRTSPKWSSLDAAFIVLAINVGL